VKLHGIFPPLATPFDFSDCVALNRLRDNVARYNRTRLAGYVVIGSTGESVLLSFEEIERIWITVREASDPSKLLIAGTGVESTAETIARTNRAAELGYQAALVKTPHYYKPQINDELLARHFLRVADGAKIPVLLYSVPQFTGVALEPPLVKRLAEHPNIIGIKKSSGNVQRIGEIIATAPAPFQTLTGSASTLYPSIALGAVGGILALSCVLPELCVELYEKSIDGNAAGARSLQRRLLAPISAIMLRNGIPGLKYAMDRVGYYGGPARAPYLPLSDAAKKDIDTALATVVAQTVASS
jgi:4-hydroxy-2-oxoglutarate aldolase